MAPTYKLTYFDVRGLAETVRYLFKYGGIEFEDVRITSENWPELKNSIHWGQLPILEFNGKQIAQSIAIARYLATLVKLTGTTPEENLEIDSIVDTITDMRLKIRTIFYEPDGPTKTARLEEARKVSFPFYMDRLEALVGKNKGHVALERLTWADFHLVNIISLLDFVHDKDAAADYPNLKALRDRVNSLPGIKEWVEVRPETSF